MSLAPTSPSRSSHTLTSLGSTCSAPATITLTLPTLLFPSPYHNRRRSSKGSEEICGNETQQQQQQQLVPHLRQRAGSTGALLLDPLARMATAVTTRHRRRVAIAATAAAAATEPTMEPVPQHSRPITPTSEPVAAVTTTTTPTNPTTTQANQRRLSPAPLPRPILARHPTCPNASAPQAEAGAKTAPAKTVVELSSSAAAAGGEPQLTRTKSAPVFLKPVLTRASSTGALQHRITATPSRNRGESDYSSHHHQEQHDYFADDPLLGNRPRHRLPRGTPSVISVGALVGQSTWLTAPSSNWSCAGMGHGAGDGGGIDVFSVGGDGTVLGNEPTLVMIGHIIDVDSPEYHASVMRANRCLETVLGVRRRQQQQQRCGCLRNELKFLWRRMAQRPGVGGAMAVAVAVRGRPRRPGRNGLCRRRLFGRRQNNDVVQLQRCSTGCLT